MTELPPPNPAANRDVRVLVAEDNGVIRNIALGRLRKAGFTVASATNGLQALEAARQTDYQVIFMDCDMPEMDGYAAATAIRAQANNPGFASRHPRIIALTGDADRERCLAAGMDDHFVKSAGLNGLETVVEHWRATLGELPAPLSAPVVPTKAASPGSVPGGALVDMERVLDLSGRTPAGRAAFAEVYLTQAAAQLEELRGAIAAGAADRVRSLAHQGKGTNAVVGMPGLSRIMAELEQVSLAGTLAGAEELVAEASRALEEVRQMLRAG